MKVTFGGREMAISEKPYRINDRFLNFTAAGKDLKDVDTLQFPKLKLVLGVPSVDTSVCSLELSKFVQETENLDMHLIAVSMDLPFAQARWCQANASKHLILLSDYKKHDFALTSDTLIHEVGLLARSAYIVDENNKIRYAEIVEDTGKEPNYQAILSVLNELLVN